MRIITFVCLVYLLYGCYLAGPSKAVSEDIARMRDLLQQRNEELPTVTAGRFSVGSNDIVMRINRPAFDAMRASFNEIPNAQRKITVRSVSHMGKIAEDFHKTFTGRVGWWLELKDGQDKLVGEVLLGDMEIRPSSDAIKIAVPISAVLSAEAHGLADPLGPGGGFSVSPIDFKANASATLITTVLPSSSKHPFGYRLEITSPQTISMPVRVDILRIGQKTFDIEMQLSEMSLYEQSLLDTDSVRGSVPLSGIGMVDRDYQLTVVNPSTATDSAGITAACKVDVAWLK